VSIFTPDDLIAGDYVWLLDLRVGGTTHHLAEEAVTANVGPLGDAISYSAGLDFGEALTRRIDPFGESPVSGSADLVLDAAAAGLDFSSLAADGHLFAAARGTLRLWARGTTRAATYIDGIVVGVAFGHKTEPITFTLREDTADDTGLFPPENARINENTWPNAADGAVGQFPPWIFGHPGIGLAYASRAFMVDTTFGAEILIVAGHAVEAASVDIINDGDSSVGPLWITRTTDGNGRTVSTVDLSASTSITVDRTARYWIRWPAGGGLLAPGGGLVGGAGQVWVYMMGFSRSRIDWPRTLNTAHALNAYRIDMAITTQERFNPWAFVGDHLLPILPIQIRSSEEGSYPSLYPLGAVTPRAILSDDRTELEAVTPLTFSRREAIRNSFTILFGQDQRADTFSRRKVLTGDLAAPGLDPDAEMSLHCVRSRSIYLGPSGQPETTVDEIQSEAVWDNATAAAILLWRAQWLSQQQPLIGFEVSADVAGHLDENDVVEVTYSPYGIKARTFVVEEIALQPGGFMGLDLRGLDDVARDG
jgi:hypothetical protein